MSWYAEIPYHRRTGSRDWRYHHLQLFLGYFVTEIGVQNQLVHLWAYKDLEDRRERRAKLAANPQWQGCLKKIRPMIMTMENRVMMPTRFSPIRTLPESRD